MKTNMKKLNAKAKHFTRRICTKSDRAERHIRRENKSETRYRIMENTMRGYFNYSI